MKMTDSMLVKQNAIKVFEEKKVRTVWDSDKEEWYFSIVDVVAVLTDSPNPRNYWKVLKHRLVKEGNESVTNCNQLKMLSSDGKYYKTDVATTEQLFQLIRARKRGKKTFKNERDGMFYQSFSRIFLTSRFTSSCMLDRSLLYTGVFR